MCKHRERPAAKIRGNVLQRLMPALRHRRRQALDNGLRRYTAKILRQCGVNRSVYSGCRRTHSRKKPQTGTTVQFLLRKCSNACPATIAPRPLP